MSQKLQNQLKDLGSKLENLPSSKDALIKLLKQVATCLSEMEQSPPKSTLESMQPFLNAIVKAELLKHQDKDVKLLVATCLCEITRITAPEAPYSDDVLRDIFHLIVSTFSGLKDSVGPSFGRRVIILETLARYRSCIVMLDLECDALVNEMFNLFLDVASDDQSYNVLSSMKEIMAALLEESEEIRGDLLLILLSALGRDRHDVTKAARKLAMDVVEQCSGKLEPYIKQFLISSISGETTSSDCPIDYHEIIYDIYSCAPQILSGVVPYLTGELLTDQLSTRLKAVKLVGDLFALPGSAASETFQPIFGEFWKRLTDRVVEVRMSVLESAKMCLLSNPGRAEADQIISALCDRLLDYDENVRKEVVYVISDVACHSLSSVPVETVKLVAERLRDKSLLVKKYTMERLADIYRSSILSRTENPPETDDLDWIPGKILRCFYDRDFRSDVIESILYASIFPTEFTAKERVKTWVRFFPTFDHVELKALEKILEQKQRLQQEMLRYLSLKQTNQENDPELQKKKLFCFRVMSRFFTDAAKGEENFQILDELTDAKIWKILTTSLDPNSTASQSLNCRDDLLKILGEKHRLFQFLGLLSMKCSYTLFDKEHVKEILVEASLQKTAGDAQLTASCMNILVLLARFSPQLLNGIEDKLLQLLEDDNEIIKEGVLHILAKAGGTIREQLGVSSSSLDLILERICLEGSRSQAKYAVHALAAVTKDDGLMSLSVLYKRLLVDMLEEKKNLPAVLQSLGCIAQAAMSVFETRESEIDGFIKAEILQCSDTGDKVKDLWDERSEVCSMKIFGLKTLVKSYMPVKDAHLRLGIDGLFEILRNILLFGELSTNIISSPVDKAHLKLAAAKAILRLSRHWDHKLPIDLFYLTLRSVEINYPQAKRQFLNKVHQYIKERLLDPKYACAFLFDMTGVQGSDFQEERRELNDIIQMCQQGKTRQLSSQSDSNPQVIFPTSVLPYVIHAFAHHSSCPKVNECRDFKAFERIYRQLHLFLSMIMQFDEDDKSEAIINKKKETTSTIVSVFQCIKNSEDVVVPELSKTSHAICEIGLHVIKKISQIEDGVNGSSASVLLPPQLYRPVETKDGDPLANEDLGWISEENALKYFESLKLEVNGMVQSEMVAEDEVMKDSETDGNELPLGKMLKRLKSKANKARKAKKDESPSAEAKNEDVDVLKMVREINLDNLGTSSRYESTNGHDYDPAKLKRVNKLRKGKTRAVSESKDVPKAKRQRSSGQGAESSMDEEHDIGFEDRSTLQEDSVQPTELGSSTGKNLGTLVKSRGKGSDEHHNHEVNDEDVKVPMELVSENKKVTNDSKSAKASAKKQKKRSIIGLSKCTAEDHVIEDLIDCRIKVWWPMDKKFYEGVVKSYDGEKKKHVVLYDDGDVEVLRLDKECWEIVDTGHKPTKRSKLMKTTTTRKTSPLSHHQHKKPVTSLQQNKSPVITSSPSKVRGKRTPRKNLRTGGKGTSNIKSSSMLVDPEPTTLPKSEDGYTGDFEGEHTGAGEDSDAEENLVVAVQNYSNYKKELEISHGNHHSQEQLNERGDSQEQDDVPLQESGEEDTEKNFSRVETDESNPEDSGIAGLPENEPLSAWKLRAGKATRRR
ncbi:sister chromatid cohesion protein PDS5 homolog A [Impatiens glandulifera]|uniref:sister chromatid cohesion protein PDS5 homolog A n=1 Tax=Impatiens glandulifera TaxID=253017 RepID=UPI001FB0BD46|nr:sister chromatid cohesion protein PDS5 homolog A [Impatiens glandulifera]